jgi:hypothetical protein
MIVLLRIERVRKLSASLLVHAPNCAQKRIVGAFRISRLLAADTHLRPSAPPSITLSLIKRGRRQATT